MSTPSQLIDSYRALPRNWDSYGADPVTDVAASAARALLATVKDDPFAVVPLPSGGIQLEWQGPASAIEVEVDPDGTFSYLLIQRLADGDNFREFHDCTANDVVPVVTRVLQG